MTLGALLEAIKIDDEKMAELIIKNGFNVNLTDRFGKTALHYSAFKGIFLWQNNLLIHALQQFICDIKTFRY